MKPANAAPMAATAAIAGEMDTPAAPTVSVKAIG